MRAYAADRHGDLSELRLRDLPTPRPGPRELLVHVKAAAINPADLKVLARRDGGWFLRAPGFPLVLGFDFSGTVVERGAAAGPAHPIGDEVYGFLPYSPLTRGGTFAEYVAVDAAIVGRKPRALSHEQAAAAATSAVSALQALRDRGRLAAGQAVLINGASGGVGSYAVRLAKVLGASVVATASAAKLDYVRRLGADRAVDYRTTRLAELRGVGVPGARGQRFSVILDIASTSSFAEAAPMLAEGGAYVGFLPSMRLALDLARGVLSSKRCTFLVVRPAAGDFEQLARWFDDGKLAPVLDRVYPLAELPAALAHQRTGAVRGKLAITI